MASFSKPIRNGWTWQSKKFIQLDEKLFPEIKWESNPIKVEFKNIATVLDTRVPV